MLKPAATWNLTLCQRTLCLPPAPYSSTPREGEGGHGDWKREFPRASSHWSLFPKAGVMGHGVRLAPFSRSSPKSQATNLGELERKLIKYTSCVFAATRVRWKPKPAAANDQVQNQQASEAIRSATPVLELSPRSSGLTGPCGARLRLQKKLNCLETA